VQLDYNQPENFDMTYIDENGKKVRPAVIHAALLGSVDRFMGIIIEQFAGAFPVWLAPVQVAVLPISEKFSDYGEKVFSALKKADTRVELSDANESLSKRIRVSEVMRIPYIVVVGEKEATDGTVSVRSRKDGSQTVMKLDEFVHKIEREIKDKTS
jgi:threonyl-tRNA synthetase